MLRSYPNYILVTYSTSPVTNGRSRQQVRSVTSCSSADQLGVPSAFVIVLNWNGWRDTTECLETLFRLEYPNCHIVVVDNGSTDGSVERICAWADGDQRLDLGNVPFDLQRYVTPPVRKPITWSVVQSDNARQPRVWPSTAGQDNRVLTIIETGANLGYAGGNNVGIRCALAHAAQYVWILNNDTIVDCRSLGCLVGRMDQDHTIGLCGCTLLEYRDPYLLQAASGAHYDYRTSRYRSLGRGSRSALQLGVREVEKSLSYVSGASVVATRAYLQDVGLMSEIYFLYFEELDWAIRGKRRGFRLGYANQALVYHKQGASTGSSERDPEPTPFAQYLYTRNLLLMTSSFYRPWFPLVWLKTLGTALKFFLTGHFALVKAVCLAILNPSFAATEPDHGREYLNGYCRGFRQREASRRG
jgi:GT2 family glycosyltransferase